MIKEYKFKPNIVKVVQFTNTAENHEDIKELLNVNELNIDVEQYDEPCLMIEDYQEVFMYDYIVRDKDDIIDTYTEEAFNNIFEE